MIRSQPLILPEKGNGVCGGVCIKYGTLVVIIKAFCAYVMANARLDEFCFICNKCIQNPDVIRRNSLTVHRHMTTCWSIIERCNEAVKMQPFAIRHDYRCMECLDSLSEPISFATRRCRLRSFTQFSGRRKRFFQLVLQLIKT